VESLAAFDDSKCFQVLEDTCVACVGVLQRADSSSVIEVIEERLTAENYQVMTYNISITLPVSLLPRNHSLALHIFNELKKNGVDIDVAKVIRNTHIDAKDPVKSIVGYYIKNKCGMQQDVSAGLKMTLVFSHPETVGDHVFLTNVSNPVVKLLKQRKKVDDLEQCGRILSCAPCQLNCM
jgi:hypothetical protein